MNNKILIGLRRCLIPIPGIIWQRIMLKNVQKIEANLSFMTEEHRLIRNFVVRELPCVGEPLSAEFIGQRLNLPVSHVNIILDELEKHLTFLFRNKQRAVSWAYPVTVDKTPHHITYNTGEQGYAA